MAVKRKQRRLQKTNGEAHVQCIRMNTQHNEKKPREGTLIYKVTGEKLTARAYTSASAKKASRQGETLDKSVRSMEHETKDLSPSDPSQHDEIHSRPEPRTCQQFKLPAIMHDAGTHSVFAKHCVSGMSNREMRTQWQNKTCYSQQSLQLCLLLQYNTSDWNCFDVSIDVVWVFWNEEYFGMFAISASDTSCHSQQSLQLSLLLQYNTSDWNCVDVSIDVIWVFWNQEYLGMFAISASGKLKVTEALMNSPTKLSNTTKKVGVFMKMVRFDKERSIRAETATLVEFAEETIPKFETRMSVETKKLANEAFVDNQVSSAKKEVSTCNNLLGDMNLCMPNQSKQRQNIISQESRHRCQRMTIVGKTRDGDMTQLANFPPNIAGVIYASIHMNFCPITRASVYNAIIAESVELKTPKDIVDNISSLTIPTLPDSKCYQQTSVHSGLSDSNALPLDKLSTCNIPGEHCTEGNGTTCQKKNLNLKTNSCKTHIKTQKSSTKHNARRETLKKPERTRNNKQLKTHKKDHVDGVEESSHTDNDKFDLCRLFTKYKWRVFLLLCFGCVFPGCDAQPLPSTELTDINSTLFELEINNITEYLENQNQITQVQIERRLLVYLGTVSQASDGDDATIIDDHNINSTTQNTSEVGTGRFNGQHTDLQDFPAAPREVRLHNTIDIDGAPEASNIPLASPELGGSSITSEDDMVTEAYYRRHPIYTELMTQVQNDPVDELVYNNTEVGLEFTRGNNTATYNILSGEGISSHVHISNISVFNENFREPRDDEYTTNLERVRLHNTRDIDVAPEEASNIPLPSPEPGGSGITWEDDMETEAYYRRHPIYIELMTQNDPVDELVHNNSDVGLELTIGNNPGNSNILSAEGISSHLHNSNISVYNEDFRETRDDGYVTNLERDQRGNHNLRRHLLEEEGHTAGSINPSPQHQVTVTMTVFDTTTSFVTNAMETIGGIWSRLLQNTDLHLTDSYNIQEQTSPNTFRNVTIHRTSEQLLHDRSFLVIPLTVLVYERVQSD